MEIFAAIEQLAPVRALKSSFYVYPLVNAAHILSIGTLVASILFLDLRILGAFRALDRRAFVRLMRRAALVALCAAVPTGVALFSVRAGTYVENPAFLLKMSLLVVAGLNLALFAMVSRNGGTENAPRVLAAVSLVLWPAILLSGRFIAFV